MKSVSAQKLDLLFFLSILVWFTCFLFSHYHIPVAELVMFISGCVLFLIFLPLYFMNKNRHLLKMQLWGLFSLLVFSVLLIMAGGVMRILHLEGGQLALTLGVGGFSLLFLPFFFYTIFKHGRPPMA